MSYVPLFETEDALPLELGEMAFTDCQVYEDPSFGVKLHYERGITKADVYLYDLGLPSISSDIYSEEVMQFFQQSCGDIFGLAERGIYLDLQTRASQYLHLPADSPDPTYLWAAFYYRQAPSLLTADEGFRFSNIFLRTDVGFINKVRYTYPEDAAATSDADMFIFLRDWQEAIKRH